MQVSIYSGYQRARRKTLLTGLTLTWNPTVAQKEVGYSHDPERKLFSYFPAEHKGEMRF